MNSLANFLTTLSLFFGFISIIFSLAGQFTFAAWSIILSVIFDGMDGQVARLNPVPNEMGKQLDSLADVVSFGVAPSILGYVFIYKQFHSWAVITLFVYLVCSVWRLAKYNITPKEELVNCFIGLPTTVSGAVLASFILIYRKKEDMLLPEFVPEILSPQFTPVIFLIIVLCLAALMVSRIRYLNLDGFKQLFGKRIKSVVLIAVILLLPAAFLKKAGATLFTFFLIYLLFSPVVVKRLCKKNLPR